MSVCLEAPSPILLQYATMGVNPAPKTWNLSMTMKKLPLAFIKPYQFIKKTQRRSKKNPRVEPEGEERKPTPEELHIQNVYNYGPQQTWKGVAPDAIVAHNAGDQSAHLSDVFEVISATDPTFGAGAADALPRDIMAQAPMPVVYIIEEPAPKSLRFRYECEGRSAGSIPGVNSTPENKTFPTIKIQGYKGCMVIVVSCVTKEEPYKPHPHNLVGRDCQMGVCTVKVKTEGDQDSCHVMFKNLGIQCVKRRDIPEALRVRQELRVNPYKTGYAHSRQPQSIDLNAVRLCFQVFLTDDAYKVQRALVPVASEVIYDKKAMSDLLIVRASHCAGTVKGGTTVILLCEKVTREDTEVWFYREENGVVTWTDRGHIEFVHKQLAIVLKTPPYCDQQINDHVQVNIQLQRLSDGAKSNPFTFEYFPEAQDRLVIEQYIHKRPKKSYLQEYCDRSLGEMPIKAEPRERTPPHPMSNYGDQQYAAGQLAQTQYSPASWASPPYVQSPPYAQSPSPHLATMLPGVANMAAMTSPHHHQQQVSSPGAASPGLLPASPYTVHVLSPHMQQQGMHMQNMPVRSPHCGSPAVSPGMIQHGINMPMVSCVSTGSNMPGVSTMAAVGSNMPGVSSMPGMQVQGVLMDPVMGEVGQQPTYTQMDTSVNSTPSLATLLANHGDEDAQFTSGDLSNFLLNERADLSDSLNRLSTRDLLQP